jgi:predicted lipid-binding transport protein (Tim44 family)
MALPFIETLEVLITGLIALVLLILAGARLILHEWRALQTSRYEGFAALPHRTSGSPDHRRKAIPKAPGKPRASGISPLVRSR